MLRTCLFLLFVICLHSSCEDETPYVPEEEDFEVPVNIPQVDAAYIDGSSDYIFDQTKLHTFYLEIPASSYADINNNPSAEQYVEGLLIFEHDTISPVGIRYKGSIGSFMGCLSGGDWLSPSGFKTCTKLSMKVKINWEGREEKFFGLKKLQFHAQNSDDSQMRERLGYWLFRSMGLAAPRSVHARLMINGEYQGLFALTEQIDGRFAKHHFEYDDGNVYKEVWPLYANGSARSNNEFAAALKTNEEQASVEIMSQFAQSLSESSESGLPAVVDQFMDRQKILAYSVVDRTIKHDDGPFHWYCWGPCNPHNFYWYEDPVEQKLHLIPWDLDLAFGNIIEPENTVTAIPDNWGEISNNCIPYTHIGSPLKQRSAACDKLVGTWTTWQADYDVLKQSLIAGPLSVDQADAQLDTWADQIRAATEEATELHEDAVSLGQWESALGRLKSQLQHARSN